MGKEKIMPTDPSGIPMEGKVINKLLTLDQQENKRKSKMPALLDDPRSLF